MLSWHSAAVESSSLVRLLFRLVLHRVTPTKSGNFPSQQNEIELFPPGGCVTRELGLSVITFPVFCDDPLAYMLLETPLSMAPHEACFFSISLIGLLVVVDVDEAAAADPTICITFSFSFLGSLLSVKAKVEYIRESKVSLSRR